MLFEGCEGHRYTLMMGVRTVLGWMLLCEPSPPVLPVVPLAEA